MLKVVAWLTFLLTALFVFSRVNSLGEPNKSISQESEELSHIFLGKELVRARLKHLDTVVFEEVFFVRDIHDAPGACGSVTSENQLGTQRFMSFGQTATYLESEITNFDALWAVKCLR